MKLTAELSLYPLNEEYIPIVQDFIARLHEHDDLTIVGNAMSTQICGQYARVFEVVAALLRASVERWGKQVLVCKFIVGELAIG